MSFDEKLARCLAGLEQGLTIDECLAEFENDAAELKPLLYLAAHLRNSPSPGLSAAAFARGRAAVAAQANFQRRLLSPFLTALTAEVNHTPLTTLPAANFPRQAARPRPFMHRAAPLVRWQGVLVALLLVLTLFTFARNIQTSLPNSPLYAVKLAGENVQAYLMVAAGQEALWQARQVKRRLIELDYLARQGSTDPAMVAQVDQKVQAALDATATMTPAERTRFLEQWLTDLRNVQSTTATNSTPALTLRRVIATVQAAAAEAPARTVLPPGELSPETPTPTPTDSPTALPLNSTAEQPMVAVTSTGPVASPTARALPRASATPTATPVTAGRGISPTPTPTFTNTPKPAPIMGSNNQSARSEPSPTPVPPAPIPTATPMPTATATVLLVPTATWTPLPTATALTTIVPPTPPNTVTATSTVSVTLATNTPAATVTDTFTATATVAPTATVTTATATPSAVPTVTDTPSAAPTATDLLTTTPTAPPIATDTTPRPTRTLTTAPTIEVTPVAATPTPEPMATESATLAPPTTSPNDEPATATPVATPTVAQSDEIESPEPPA